MEGAQYYIEVDSRNASKAAELYQSDPQFDLYIDKVSQARYESDDLNTMITFLQRMEDYQIEILDSNVGEHMDSMDADFSLEEMDINDPVMMKLRAAMDARREPDSKTKMTDFGPIQTPNFANEKKIAALKKYRLQVMADREQLLKYMEQEAEPAGGPIADNYGELLMQKDEMLAKIDRAIARLSGKSELSEGGTDQDEDGDVDSDDYMISKDKAIKKAMGKKVKKSQLKELVKRALEEQPMGVGGQQRGAVVMPKTTNPMDIKKVTDKGVDVKLAEEEAQQYFDYTDDEGRMAKSQLLHLAEYAAELYRMMDDETQLEGWVQAKITKACDYISAVKHYLEGEAFMNATQGMEPEGPLDEELSYNDKVAKFKEIIKAVQSTHIRSSEELAKFLANKISLDKPGIRPGEKPLFKVVGGTKSGL